MLDVDYGCYPYVTSSNVLPSVAHDVGHKIGVLKAYTSRVGDGPPNVPEVEWLCAAGDEYGTTTGRARRCTWMIMDEVRYAMSIVKPDSVVVTKLDILEEHMINVWDNGDLIQIGTLDDYKQFLLEQFPQIKYFSEAADGDLIEV
jgi:adenylosuccinate synthase